MILKTHHYLVEKAKKVLVRRAVRVELNSYNALCRRDFFGAYLHIEWRNQNTAFGTRIDDSVSQPSDCFLIEPGSRISSTFYNDETGVSFSNALSIDLPCSARTLSSNQLLFLDTFKAKFLRELVE